jgi:hypothetical protein
MNFRTIIILGAILPAVPLYARGKADVMFMNNGDRMTCEVKVLEAGVLYVDFEYIDGTVSVNWWKVARLESKRLFHVKTEDGSVYTGTLSTPETAAGRTVEIHVVETPQHEAVIAPSQIVRMTATSNKFWQRFNGGINLGVICSKGNQSTQYSLGSMTEYVRERWNARASFDSSLSSSTGVNASTRNSLNLGASHLLPWNQWFYSGLGEFLQSSEQGIALQSTLGGGLGRYLTNTDRASVSVLGGAAWQSTRYKQSIVPPSGQNVVAALIYAEAKLFKFSKTNLDATATLLPALSDPGRIRLNTNVSYYIKLISNLKWNVSFYGNWDNRPPPGFSGSDYGTSSGISLTFGLK